MLWTNYYYSQWNSLLSKQQFSYKCFCKNFRHYLKAFFSSSKRERGKNDKRVVISLRAFLIMTGPQWLCVALTTHSCLGLCLLLSFFFFCCYHSTSTSTTGCIFPPPSRHVLVCHRTTPAAHNRAWWGRERQCKLSAWVISAVFENRSLERKFVFVFLLSPVLFALQ